jgi:hypothetical protein
MIGPFSMQNIEKITNTAIAPAIAMFTFIHRRNRSMRKQGPALGCRGAETIEIWNMNNIGGIIEQEN